VLLLLKKMFIVRILYVYILILVVYQEKISVFVLLIDFLRNIYKIIFCGNIRLI